jgi:hypothetical protein
MAGPKRGNLGLSGQFIEDIFVFTTWKYNLFLEKNIKKRKNFAFLEKSSSRRGLKLCWVLASKEVETLFYSILFYALYQPPF